MMIPVTYLPLAFALLTLPAAADVPAQVEGSLEPSINGEVSAGTLPPASVAAAARIADDNLGLEPCMNGAVSASGAFPTQAMEDAIHAYLTWSNTIGQPYYLFRVAGHRLSAAVSSR